MPEAADYMVRLAPREGGGTQGSYQPVTSEGVGKFKSGCRDGPRGPGGAVGEPVWTGGGVGKARTGEAFHKGGIRQHGPSRRVARHGQGANLSLQEQGRVWLPPVRRQPLRQSRPDIQETDRGNHTSSHHRGGKYLLGVARRIPRSPLRSVQRSLQCAVGKCRRRADTSG